MNNPSSKNSPSMLNHYQALFELLSESTRLKAWLPEFQELIEPKLSAQGHGDFDRWSTALNQLPHIDHDRRHLDLPLNPNLPLNPHRQLNQDRVGASPVTPLSTDQQQSLQDTLMSMIPWRKGPFELHGVHIDTEWRSDFKWQRLQDHISPLEGRRVLDVGCGNGYHCWRMLGAGARMVLGIDPSVLSVMQFHAIKHFMGPAPVFVAPLRMEQFCTNSRYFDSVFSMGVLYHRKAPLDHLVELKNSLKSGGELILETLVIDGDENSVMVPEGRYARMNNVWYIPSPLALEKWLRRSGFKNIRTVDINTTQLTEQHSTDWMPFNSLKDFLDPHDIQLTHEGLPAPTRAITIAEAP